MTITYGVGCCILVRGILMVSPYLGELQIHRIIQRVVCCHRSKPVVLPVLLLILVGASRLAAEPLPPLRPLDSFPNAAAELKIDWKPSWDETLAANNEAAWNQTISQKEAYRQVADRIVRIWRIELLQQMMTHFPADRAKHIEACRAIAEIYRGVDDRTRSAHWLKKLAEVGAGDAAVTAEAYAGILRLAETPESLPNARGWVEYALSGIATMEKAGTVQRAQPAAVIARQRAFGLPLRERRYEDARRVIENYEAIDGRESWLTNRVALLTAAGQFQQAAELYELGGTNTVQSKELRGHIRPVSLDNVGNRMLRDLEMRMGALLLAKDAGADSAINHPDVVQDTLKIGADNAAMWSPSSSQRVLSWLAVDQMLRNLKPAELVPLRELQERGASTVIRQLDPASDDREVTRIFQRFPWAASMHEFLVVFGETSLREGKWNQALRAFQNALTYSADPVVIAQARVGSWLAMASASVTSETLAESMAAVPNDAQLPWRGKNIPAAEVKQAMQALVPAGAAATPALANLRRLKLRLPVSLATDEPVPLAPFPSPRGLGPWSICRIEADGDLLFVMGTGHVACYNANDLSLRWVQSGNPSLDASLKSSASIDDGARWPEASWRPVSMGAAWSRAVMDRAGKGATKSVRILYSLLRYNLRQGMSTDVAAFDALNGQVLWHTRDQADWAGLEPMSEPVAADGLVYIVAAAGAGPACQVYLVCVDGVTGKTVWKKLLGTAPVEGELRELARLGSAVTIFQEAVYVSTSVGLIARCNAHDGTVEWVRSYASAIQSDRLADQFRREGTSPIVTAAGQVIVAPRDHSGVLALNRTTGALLWETVLVPSEQMIGIVDNKLLLRGRDELAALDVATGKELWSRSLGIETSGARALIAGTDVVVVSREKLLRIAAATGATSEELRCTPGVGSDQFLLPNGALVEVSQDAPPAAAAKLDSSAGTPLVPMTNDWTYACANALLVLPPADREPKNTFGILADRSFICVTTKPRCGIAWQTLLRDGVDSAGFHGKHVVIARGRDLTTLDATSGALSWMYRLPFDATIVAGDDRVIVVSDLTADGKVAALDAKTGALLWYRWFGKEMRFAGNQPGWISMRATPADPPTVLLHWKSALFGKEGPRPAEAEIDALTGNIREVRPFLGDEPGWPARIFFGDSARTYTRKQPFFFPSHRLGLRRDEVALLSKENRIRFFPYGPGAELASGWKHKLDMQQEGKYNGALGLGATPAGSYVKQLQQLFCFDDASGKEIVYESPSADTERTVWRTFDWREFGDKLVVVSAGQPPPAPRGWPAAFTHTNLKDDTGKGDVTLKWFTAVNAGSGGAQVANGTVGLPEAGVNPVTTLLDGKTKEHYRPQFLEMSGLTSLGWDKYDVYFYTPASATINGGDEQKTTGFDARNPIHRTSFIRNVNYVKFANVTGDSFKIEAGQADFAAIQIVNASTNAAASGRPASLGVNWDGGGIGLGPDDKVGAEVQGSFWYNIAVGGQLQGGYQSPVVYLDVFDRNTGALLQTQKVNVAPRDHRLSGYDNQAVILDDALVVADQRGVQVLRTAPPGPAL